MTTAPEPQTVTLTRSSRLAPVLVPAAAGVAVSVALGGYGRVHEPTSFAVNVAGFSSGLYVKVWLTTLAAGLAVVQLVSAAAMYGRLPGRAPRWTGGLHRWSGRVAVPLTRRGLPGWALPMAGGLVFAGLAVLWTTSSLWVFTTLGVHL